jgi:CRP-like cAMP-binding protein
MPTLVLGESIEALVGGRNPRDLWDSWPGVSLRTRSDQQVYEAGDPADDVYLLLDGSLIVRTGEDQRQVALVLEAPAMWGDIELLAAAPLRAASLDAVGVACLLRFDLPALLAARSKTSFLEWHERDLAERLHRMLLSGSGAWAPLERRLLHLLRVFAGREERLAPERLARMTGASLKAVQRALRKIEQEAATEAASPESFVHSIARLELQS